MQGCVQYGGKGLWREKEWRRKRIRIKKTHSNYIHTDIHYQVNAQHINYWKMNYQTFSNISRFISGKKKQTTKKNE
jgi:hypothetical protein